MVKNSFESKVFISMFLFFTDDFFSKQINPFKEQLTAVNAKKMSFPPFLDLIFVTSKFREN
jgi:hypothetical protein